ncbi:MAG: aspartate/glutamate racemase family protein [Curvibacter sp.]|nr:aspartate/glutamate racemase family protein [Curvibacter sp.]
MKIKIINPNTSRSMTELIGRCARQRALPGTEVLVVHPSMGPASIESHYDEVLAVPGLLQEIRSGEAQGVGGHVIACFGDPGLQAAREIASGPVLGIAESAMHLASLVAPRFSVVTTLGRTVGQAWHLAEVYGMRRFCANVRACEIPVLELDRPGSGARQRILAECRQALREDRAEAIVLGCAGMADLCDELTALLGVPVIDGVGAAVKLLEALSGLGLRTSKHGEWALPPAKPVSGLLADFSLLGEPVHGAA